MSYCERKGLLLIADISGYTEYLEHEELQHAQAIIAQLLESVIDVACGSLELVKLEGDAAFFVAEDGPKIGDLVLGAVHTMFEAFHRRLREIEHATTCQCAGCVCACKMALKFVGHYGSFAEHHIHGLRELIGPDVILLHRLLKNTVEMREYALFSEALVDKLGEHVLPFKEHTERYKHIGIVTTAVLDLEPYCRGFHRHVGS